MIFILVLLLLIVVAVYVFMQQPQFGKAPSGARLERIKQSPNYRNGQFQNISVTPQLAEGTSYFSVLRTFFFGRDKRATPKDRLPSKKIDLLNLDPAANVLVWFGHSSYFMQLDGKKILVDPVLSGGASPVKFTTRSFAGADRYTTDDLPAIDYLFISHDHYDHLDYQTIVKLQPKVSNVITGLGVGAHLESWGYKPAQLIERDWNEEVILDNGFVVHTTTARHFSGRKFSRNNTLWMSFVLKTPTQKIFIGGDSGYDDHFKKIGAAFGPFDLVILENGQYNAAWKYIHMMPEEVVQAAADLQTKTLLPVHWGKFSLSVHAWDEPIKRVTNKAKQKGMPLAYPLIGDAFFINQPAVFTEWWNGVN